MVVMIWAMAKGETPQEHPTSSAVDSSRSLGRAFFLAVELPYLGFEGTILGAKVVQDSHNLGVINPSQFQGLL